VIYCRTE